MELKNTLSIQQARELSEALHRAACTAESDGASQDIVHWPYCELYLPVPSDGVALDAVFTVIP